MSSSARGLMCLVSLDGFLTLPYSPIYRSSSFSSHVRLSVCKINPRVSSPWYFKHSFCCLLQKSLTMCLKQFMSLLRKLSQSRRKKWFIHSPCVQVHQEERNRRHPSSTILSRFCIFIFSVDVSLLLWFVVLRFFWASSFFSYGFQYHSF